MKIMTDSPIKKIRPDGRVQIHSGTHDYQYHATDLQEGRYIPLGWTARLIDAGSAHRSCLWELIRS